MTDQQAEKEEIIQTGDMYGHLKLDDKFYNDQEELGDEMVKNKIINVKIYYNSGFEETDEKDGNDDENEEEAKKENKEGKVILEEKYIVGISLTYKNIYNGKTKVIEHKGSDKVAGMRELNIQGNEYLKKFTINFKNNLKRISQIGFITNKNKEISVGTRDGEDKNDPKNNEDNVITGCFGYLDKRINSLGCFYVKRKILIKNHLFKFFVLRKLVINNKEFKEKWDNHYNELSTEYQFMWKAVNLPNGAFGEIIKFCFI